MIFILKDTATGKEIFLSEQKEYVVGRKNCDILLENDQSISRKHGIIRVKDDHVTIEDCKSKYYTLHNGAQVKPEVEIRLKHMDLLQFGMFNSKFCFEAYKFITAASALSSNKKLTLKENLTKCNGKYVEKWSSCCTHLTVDKITLTIKVLQALIDEKPIVTPEYWEEYIKSIENNVAPPDLKKFNKPPVAEQLLTSDFEFKYNPGRKTLFKDKMFVFLLSNIKNQMEDVIKSCGGECMAWDKDGPKTFYEISASPKEYIFIKTSNGEENVSFNAVIGEMAKQNKRAIPLNEIALAIVHCSCEINCNPNYNKLNKVFGAHTQKQHTMGILAAETETENMVPHKTKIKTEEVIPPSVEDDWPINISNNKEVHEKTAGPSGVKRASNNQENIVAFKKPRMEKAENERPDKEKSIEIGNSSSVQQKIKATNKADDNYIKSKPQPSQKRKADEELEKSSAKKINPFSLIRLSSNQPSKSSDEENPFELTRKASERSLASKCSSNDDDNPFARISRLGKRTCNVEIKEEPVVPKKEPRKEIQLVPFKTDMSCLSSLKRSFLNSTWMSKCTTTVKSEIKEVDEELQKIAEVFRNCVRVEVLPAFNRSEHSKVGSNNTSVGSGDGKNNFKKFKKVKPIKPQVTIIPRNQFTKVAPGSVAGIQVNELNDSDDEDGRNVSAQAYPKQRVKKFVL